MKNAQHHSLLEKRKWKPHWSFISHQLEPPSSKSLQAISTGEGVEKREPSYTAGGNANWYSCYGEQCGDSLKNWKQNFHMAQQSHCWAYTLRKPELKESHVPQWSLQHRLIARSWKQPRCPLADEWIRNLRCIYTMEYYSAIMEYYSTIKRNAFE